MINLGIFRDTYRQSLPGAIIRDTATHVMPIFSAGRVLGGIPS